MILRRVIAHFRKQEWTAIALDFLIVVLGVFVGLQVNNWNEARRERAKEYGYLLRLHEDLARSIATIDRTVGMLERQSAGQTAFLDALARCAVPPGASGEIENAISTLGYINAPIFSSRTYDELTSSGSFDIIENEEIRTGLSDIVRRVGHLNHTVENIYRLTEHHRFTVEEHVLFTNIKPYDDFGSSASVEYDIGELCRRSEDRLGRFCNQAANDGSFLRLPGARCSISKIAANDRGGDRRAMGRKIGCSGDLGGGSRLMIVDRRANLTRFGVSQASEIDHPVLLRNYSITPTRAPADTRDASHPAPIGRAR